MEKVLIFDIWGDYAHFHRYFTTTSPLSFPFPPRTVLCGLISAIIGIDRENYLSHFKKDAANIALKLINPVKKFMLSKNLINTQDDIFILLKKVGHEPRTQIRFELMKNVKYRIYFNHSDTELYEKCKSFIKAHKSFYTPYLGQSEFLCNFSYVNETKAELKKINEFVEIDSVIPTPILSQIDFEETKEYFTTTIPAEMDVDRTVTEYEEVLYERNCKKIKAKLKSFWELNDNERICFL